MDREKKVAWFGVLVAALGYFVDVYDLILFSVVRVPSLGDLGFSGDALLSVGVRLLNFQMAGMLTGGLLWGIWGDKRGRISVLFGSIFLYSVANLLNATVHDITTYSILRFIAGLGLAGELGAGITLVSEMLDPKSRSYGTTIVATVGVFGAVVASLVAQRSSWRTAYVIGGILGLLLLALRFIVHESGLYLSLGDYTKGDIRLLFTRKRFARYMRCICSGLPIWFAIGIFVTFSPEFGKALEMTELPTAAQSVLHAYIGLVAGDLASGLLSQKLKSRRLTMFLFIAIAVIASLLLVSARHVSLHGFYLLNVFLGFGVGYWAVFVTTAAEQFGTNIRATVTTTVPNFVRGAVVPMTSLFVALKPYFGIIPASLTVGAICVSLALLSVYLLQESFGRNLDFLES